MFNSTHAPSGLMEFSNAYTIIHKPLSLAICIFGTTANALNILILSKRSMRSSTNSILTGLSIAQLLLLINYVILLCFNHLMETCTVTTLRTSYGWTMYKLVNVNLNIAFHSTSVFHTLCISLFRLLAVKFPHFSRRLLNTRNSQMVALTLHIIMPLLCIPTFFSTRVALIEGAAARRNPGCGCRLNACYDLVYAEDSPIFRLIFWIYGIGFKLLPCLTIAFSSFVLISSLETIQNRSRHLLTSRKFLQKRYKRRRLTKMLVIISLTCAAVETPHATLHLLTGIVGVQFGRQVYDNLGDFFEMLTLLYSSINFVMYCMMNEEFRRAVKGQVSCSPSVPRHWSGVMSDAAENVNAVDRNNQELSKTKNNKENRSDRNGYYSHDVDETELVCNIGAPCSKSSISDQS